MTLLAPLWLALAGVAALGVVALHLITTRRPPPSPFPTARFVPEGEARATARAARPADVLLLALRVAALLLLGVAAARPVSRSTSSSSARVVAVDRSRGAGPTTRDSALAIWRAGDALVLFDSSARWVEAGATDSLRALATVGAPGAISPALVAAARAAHVVAPHADSVELVLISPVLTDELDAASLTLAARWRGRVRVVRAPPAVFRAPQVTLAGGDPADGLRPAIDAINADGGTSASRAPVRAVRDTPSAADSAAARAGAAVVHWPRIGDRRAGPAAVWSAGATLVAPLAHMELGGGATRVARVVARWADGSPAAVESALGAGCIRVVSVGLPAAGDIVLQPAFLSLARQLLAPCASTNTSQQVSDSTRRAFEHGPLTSSQSAIADDSSPVAPWLAGLALLLLLAELAVRRPARAPA